RAAASSESFGSTSTARHEAVVHSRAAVLIKPATPPKAGSWARPSKPSAPSRRVTEAMRPRPPRAASVLPAAWISAYAFLSQASESAVHGAPGAAGRV